MGKVASAAVGVLASALVGGGAYGLEIAQANAERAAIADCASDFEGDTEQACLNNVEGLYGSSELLGYVQFVGVVGIIGCGYLGYKAVKEDVGTTGIIEDSLG